MVVRWDAFLTQVKDRGAYPTLAEAEHVTRVVLPLLGAHLAGTERAELANRLPETCAVALLAAPDHSYPLDPERFVRAAAGWIDGATEQSAQWDVSAVLSAVADAADEDLLHRLLLQLPIGYEVLFGRLEA